LKSYFLFSKNLFAFSEKSLKSNSGVISKLISPLSIFITSDKFFTLIISIQGIIEASGELSYGTKILLKPFSLAFIVAGKILFTFLKSQFKDNSQIKIEFSINFSSISPELSKIPIAIGKSKLGQVFFMSAGARFTIILVVGNFFQEFFNADLILSLLS
jgi:hypothetical protein